MEVRVKLYATLSQYAPEGTKIGEAFSVELENGTIRKLIHTIGFSEEKTRIIMVNGDQTKDLDRQLKDDDLVVIFPPVGGGNSS
ncbi:MAG: MoaD/ThiS family protein [Candidatus Thorarchaeota archaeon]|nr:MoaD/ThiS family protein [Candidatus Thorarchaeota archaeon]